MKNSVEMLALKRAFLTSPNHRASFEECGYCRLAWKDGKLGCSCPQRKPFSYNRCGNVVPATPPITPEEMKKIRRRILSREKEIKKMNIRMAKRETWYIKLVRQGQKKRADSFLPK